jgi:hypothetical protein
MNKLFNAKSIASVDERAGSRTHYEARGLEIGAGWASQAAAPNACVLMQSVRGWESTSTLFCAIPSYTNGVACLKEILRKAEVDL